MAEDDETDHFYSCLQTKPTKRTFKPITDSYEEYKAKQQHKDTEALKQFAH